MSSSTPESSNTTTSTTSNTTSDDTSNTTSDDTSTLPPTPHTQHINMLSMLYPNIPKNAISAIYLSNDNKNLGERMRQTKDVLEQIEARRYFQDGVEEQQQQQQQDESGKSSSESEAPPIDITSNEQKAEAALSPEDEKQIEATRSWFSSISNKFSFWDNVAESAEGTDNAPPKLSWWNYLKERLAKGPLPPIQVTNKSDHNIAISTYGPFDLHVPIKTIADIVRMIQNGTLKLTRVDSNGGTGVLKERLGPGCIVSFAASRSGDGSSSIFEGEGWFHVGFKFTAGFSEAQYEYPKDFSVHKLPIHVVNAVPGIGPYYYQLLKYLID